MYKIIYLLILFFVFIGCEQKKSDTTYIPTGRVVKNQKYLVGIHPYLNSKKMHISYRPILNYLEKELGDVSFELITSTNYDKYDKKLYPGLFHFSLPNPYQTYMALSKNYSVIAKMKPDSVFRGIFVARKDANITSVSQLKGKDISFPAPTALAATMMPLLFLQEQGLQVATDINKKFVGSQYSSILNAYSSNTIMAATWPPPWKAWSKENPQKAKEMKVIWETEPLVNNGFVVRDDVDRQLANRVATALVGLSQNKEGAQLLKNAGFDGFEFADNDTYDVVAVFLKKYNKVLGLSK